MRRTAWLMGALLLAACSDDAPVESAAVRIPSVLAAPVVAIDVEERIEASGELQARFHTAIAAEVAGRITQIRVVEGAPVDADGIVLEIDPQRRHLELEAARASLAQAEASLRKETRQADRVRKLFGTNATSRAKLDEAETALQLAAARVDAERADLGVAERALADASVRAPFAGLVARRTVSVGEFVQPGTELFELVSLDPVEVVFHLAEIDSSRVAVGQAVNVSVAPYPDQTFRAVVTVVSPTIDPATRTLRVKAEIPNADGRLRPGLFARADLGVNLRRDVVMVPEEALLQRTDGNVVFGVLPDGRVRRLIVQRGLEHEGWVEVRGALGPGDQVVKRGHAGLIDGAVVVLRESDGGPLETDVAAGREEGADL